jgi:hypothetical protein
MASSQKFCSACILVLLSIQPLFAETILPKEDAVQMFGISKDQWRKNLSMGKSAGVMDYVVTQNDEYTMRVRTQGLLEVTPIYEGRDTPVQLKIKITYDEEPYATVHRALSKSNVHSMFVEAMKDMRPEYSVSGHMNRSVSGPVEIYFTVVIKGSFPKIDLINEKGTACFTSCINPAKSNMPFDKTEQRSGGYIKYKNKEYGFEFQYPETWKEKKPGQGSSVKVLVKNCPLCGQQESFNVAANTGEKKLDGIDNFKKYFEAPMKNMFPDAKIIDNGEIYVGGVYGNYFLIKFTLRKGGVILPWMLKQILIDRGGFTYVLSLGSNPEHQDLVQPIFEKILSSFEFF